MIKIQNLVNEWFERWEKGDYQNLPISDDFTHTSPFGEIESKKSYLEIIEKNEDKFLDYTFKIHEKIFENNMGCVRYTAIQEDFRLEVTEWYYCKNDKINTILSYYHIGEIREDRRLKSI